MSNKNEVEYNEDAVQMYLDNPWLFKDHVDTVIIGNIIDKRLEKVLALVEERDNADTSNMSESEVTEMNDCINQQITEHTTLDSITKQMVANIIEAENRMVKSGLIRRILNPEALEHIQKEEKEHNIKVDENSLPQLPPTAVKPETMLQKQKERRAK